MMDWQPIETAPEGVPRIAGAAKVCWMLLAWPDGEGDFHTGHGMRVNDKFYSTAIFYCGGTYDGKQYEYLELEVFPTNWAPIPEPPVTDIHNSEDQ